MDSDCPSPLCALFEKQKGLDLLGSEDLLQTLTCLATLTGGWDKSDYCNNPQGKMQQCFPFWLCLSEKLRKHQANLCMVVGTHTMSWPRVIAAAKPFALVHWPPRSRCPNREAI